MPSQPAPPSPPLPPLRLEVPSAAGAYPVVIAGGSSLAIGAALDEAGLPARRFIVSSPTVWRFHGDRLRAACGEEPILLPDGERFKHLATVGRIYEALIRAAADRATTIIAVGGGVVGDIAGFAAATYLRGVPVVQVPTTLLAQVDSAIGGKVGVNHALGKNLIGAFHAPAAVIIDPELLPTLPRREFRAGLYEVVKYGVIASRTLFDRVAGSLTALFAHDAAALVPVIAECCRIKAAIVGEDEREAGPRRALNFGHTAGHALEAVTRYRRFRHGEAVAYGMRVAAGIASRRGLLPEPDREALARLIMQMGPLPPIADLAASELLEVMRRDKKVVAGRLHFVLPAEIGRTVVVDDVGEDELTYALAQLGVGG
jgi:3-dehydroquinate synthase